MSSQATCHPGCLKSDPRRVILCQCNCAGMRHGEKWVEEHGVDEIRKYYAKLQARWDKWDLNTRKRTLRIRALSGGKRVAG